METPSSREANGSEGRSSAEPVPHVLGAGQKPNSRGEKPDVETELHATEVADEATKDTTTNQEDLTEEEQLDFLNRMEEDSADLVMHYMGRLPDLREADPT